MPQSAFVMPGAQPFFARGGATGVLVMHGFTASPSEVLWLAQHLAVHGHTVYAPRLPGHGTDPHDLARTRWQDWAASAMDGIGVLRAQCARIFVVGLSMGGALSLFTASQIPVDGVVALAAPLVPFPGMTPARLRILKRLRPFTDQTDRSPFAAYVAEQQAQRGEPALGRVRYGLWSTAGVEQLTLMMAQAAAGLPRITAPVLGIYSSADATVRPHNLDALRAGLTRAARVETHLLTQSSHILTQDMEKETVFRLVSDFIVS